MTKEERAEWCAKVAATIKKPPYFAMWKEAFQVLDPGKTH